MGSDAGARRTASARGPATLRVLAELEALQASAGDEMRVELGRLIGSVRDRLEDDRIVLAVLGEFKQGKSTLVNALLRTDVCPVDADLGTAVPTVIAFGTPATAAGVVAERSDGSGARSDAESEPSVTRVPLDVRSLAGAVLERQATGAPSLSTVEVALDRALLRTGLTIIDTPGLGGLESAHGVAALGVLPLAHAVLFVTDASQELTRPELDFLRQVTSACPTVICVLTKTDLHADWPRIADLDREHLERAGLSVPVIEVSSFLRMRAAATRDPGLHERSGFPALLEALRVQVLRRADALAVAAVRADLEAVRGQLQQDVVAEREVLQRPPEEKQEVVHHLERVTARASRLLSSSSANWYVVLNDEIQDLKTDAAHDLQQRLLSVRRAGEAKLDAGDPRETWGDFESWVRTEVMAAAVANVQMLVERADQLAVAVGERFRMEVDALDVDLPVPALALSRITGLRVDFPSSASRQLVGMLTAARISYGGAVVGGAAGSALVALTSLTAAVASTFVPLGAAATLVLARRLIRDDRNREVELRRQLAKQEFGRYLEEVALVLRKESQDAATRTTRYLRDAFDERAKAVHETSAKSLERASRAAQLDPRAAQAKLEEIEGTRLSTSSAGPGLGERLA